MLKIVVAFLALASVQGLLEEGPAPPIERQLKNEDRPKLNGFETLQKQCSPKDIDIFFVIDKSGSIGTKNFETVKKFLEDVVGQMVTTGDINTRSRVGLVSFDDKAKMNFNLLAYDNTPAFVLNSGIEALGTAFGQTNIASGMNLATMVGFTAANGDRPNSENVMVVLTDGQDNTDVAAAHQAAALKGVKVIAIGVTDDVSYDELKAITGGDESLVYHVATFDNLTNIVDFDCDFSICDANPCLHDGTCVPNEDNTDFTCVCPPHWHGRLCEIPDDPCFSLPCMNGGSCHDEGNDTYSCICPAGCTGHDCDTCYCHGGKFKCDCDFGWEGNICSHPHDFCNQTDILTNGQLVPIDICGPHGKCQNSNVGISCLCDAGWTGLYCETNPTSCANHPCLNGGTCENIYGGGYKCNCPELYTGDNCEQIINFCDDLEILGANGDVEHVHICGEHGQCFNSNTGANCLCDAAWTGEFCQTEIPFNCTYTDSNGSQHTYPHASKWVDDCNECFCRFGNVTCAQSIWCPHKCAIYATTRTIAEGIQVGCGQHENCIPNEVECAAPLPTCDYPTGWCFPVGHIMIDTLTLPTNPPQGWTIINRK